MINISFFFILLKLNIKMLTLNQFLKNNKWQSFWIIISSLLINILALSSAIYVIQVFNKYLTYKLDSTLLILTIGVINSVYFRSFFTLCKRTSS